MSAQDVADIVAFLRTLTDGFEPALQAAAATAANQGRHGLKGKALDQLVASAKKNVTACGCDTGRGCGHSQESPQAVTSARPFRQGL
jgi:hypothetical protein